LRDPSLISIDPVNRSFKSIVLNKFQRLVNTDKEIFQLCCAGLHSRRLAKIVLPLTNEQKTVVFSLLSKTKVNSIRVEVNSLEAKLFKDSELKFKNKTDEEISLVSDKWEESLFRKSYGALRELERLIKSESVKFEAFDTSLYKELARPYVFTEIIQFKDDSIRQMVRTIGINVLEKAFFFVKDDPSIERFYKIIPSLKATLNKRFEQIYDFDDTDVAFNALNKALCGKLVLCNDLEYDGVWITHLFKAANIGVQFTLTDIRYLYEYWGEDKANAFKKAYESIVTITCHRALPDAERFVKTFKRMNSNWNS
jgi:hypothetical protein